MQRMLRFLLAGAVAFSGFTGVAAGHELPVDPGLRVGEVRSDIERRDAHRGDMAPGVRVGEIRELRDSKPPTQIGGSDQRLWDIELRNEVRGDGSVTGVVANLSSDPVQDIQLLVSHAWLWSNETKPGDSGPGRARYVTLPGLLPPGTSVDFRYEPIPPLPYRSDGRFDTRAEIVGFDRITYETVPAGTHDRSDFR